MSHVSFIQLRSIRELCPLPHLSLGGSLERRVHLELDVTDTPQADRGCGGRGNIPGLLTKKKKKRKMWTTVVTTGTGTWLFWYQPQLAVVL